MSEHGNVWYCKIGFGKILAAPLTSSPDQLMREAVEVGYGRVTAQKPDFIFSGWGAHLKEAELAVIEDREPDPELSRIFFVLKAPSGVLRASTLAMTEDNAWSKALDIVAFTTTGLDEAAARKELIAGGYSVVPVELNELRD